MTEMSNPSPTIPTLNYTSAAGEALAPIAGNVHLLQQAADYRRGLRLLNRIAQSDVIWGGLCVGMALLFYKLHYFATALFVIGGAMLAVGILIKIKPSPLAILADGTLLLALAGVNAWRYFHFSHRGNSMLGPQPPLYLWICVICLLAGLMRFRRYKPFAAVSHANPSRETMQWLTEMHRLLQLGSPNQFESMIRFDSSSFPPLSLKAQLLPELAICLVNQTRLQFATQKDFTIEPIAKNKLSRKIKVNVRLGDNRSKGLMTPESLERFTRWKSDDPENIATLELDE